MALAPHFRRLTLTDLRSLTCSPRKFRSLFVFVFERNAVDRVRGILRGICVFGDDELALDTSIDTREHGEVHWSPPAPDPPSSPSVSSPLVLSSILMSTRTARGPGAAPSCRGTSSSSSSATGAHGKPPLPYPMFYQEPSTPDSPRNP